MNVPQIFTARLPHQPYCSNTKRVEQKRPAADALAYKNLQFNSPVSAGWLVFDVDYNYRERRESWQFPILPQPTISVVNPENGHAHIFYGLETPVATSDLARVAPLRYLAAVEAGYRTALEADPGYTGLMAKNPLHEHWQVEYCEKLYDLAELAEYVDLPKQLPIRTVAGLGRNCSLYDELRAYAYKNVRQYRAAGVDYARFHAELVLHAVSLNVFVAPLATAEVNAIARSVSKWVWQNFDEATFSKIQAVRGRASGAARLAASADKRDRARVMAACGASIREIALALEVGKSTVGDWLSSFVLH